MSECPRVLIDTSVWVEAFHGGNPWVLERVRSLLEEDRAAICGPVEFEIRQGLRDRERERVLPLLEAVPRLEFLESDWAEAGDLGANLRRRGVTVPALDLLIAAVCRRTATSLLTLDKHFRSVEGLSLDPLPEPEK